MKPSRLLLLLPALCLAACLLPLGCCTFCSGCADDAAAPGVPAADAAAPGVPAAAAAAPNTLTAAEREAGWQLLFDGRTTAGWRGFRRTDLPDGWTVEDGALARTGGGGDIITQGQFGDFELRLQWRISPGGNSGLFFHVTEEGGAVYETGPEMQVLDNAGHPDGQSPFTSAGSNYGLYAPPTDVTRPVGAWNDVRLRVQQGHVQHWLNGTKVVDYQLGSPGWEALLAQSKFTRWPGYGRAGRGHIALQDHGDPVWYRDIKLLRLE